MLKVAVTGCSLADYLYKHISFETEAFRKYTSKRDGDGGLAPGKLVFAEDLEKFAGVPYPKIKTELGAGEPDAFNLGGPGIVGAINAAQITEGGKIGFSFYGCRGDDTTGHRIQAIVERTPVDVKHYGVTKGSSPCTDVLSDPAANEGKGERTFINTIGTSLHYGPKQLPADFFKADVAWFGATALVPELHDSLTSLLCRAKKSGAVTVISTVFDFRNEKKFPDGRWPLGESDESYRLTDVLITDRDEAFRMSGTKKIEDAAKFFIDSGVGAFLVTFGAKSFYAWSRGTFFRPMPFSALPTCRMVDDELSAHPEKRGDTTGCGDNFAGGVVASLSSQLEAGVRPGNLDMGDACAWGAASGGFACFYLGGTYLEKTPGEKRARMQAYHDYSLPLMHA